MCPNRIMASTLACRAEDPGPIPGLGVPFLESSDR